MTWLVIAISGATGAVCRYVLDFVITQRVRGVFPWGTWTVNVAGSLLVGVVAGLSANAGHPTWWQVAAGAGFCGAFTTFSTFMFETLQLAERRAYRAALWNLASLLFGVAAAAAGWWLAT